MVIMLYAIMLPAQRMSYLIYEMACHFYIYMLIHKLSRLQRRLENAQGRNELDPLPKLNLYNALCYVNGDYSQKSAVPSPSKLIRAM